MSKVTSNFIEKIEMQAVTVKELDSITIRFTPFQAQFLFELLNEFPTVEMTHMQSVLDDMKRLGFDYSYKCILPGENAKLVEDWNSTVQESVSKTKSRIALKENMK